ncbi:Uncharacterised protein [uncultured archaeon]|nr:Uncharacterised protein [uncultured archaeon]
MLDYETDILEASVKLGYNNAVELYRENKVSLGKASEIADLSYEEMKELLIKNKVEIRRGPASLKELRTRAEELVKLL